jgi:hypothetical protein
LNVDNARPSQKPPGSTGDGTTTADAPAHDAGLRGASSVPNAGVLKELSNVLASARETVSNFLELVSLEARRAGVALVWMIAWGVMAGVCLVATWCGLMAALAMWVIALGLAPILTVLLVTLLNLAIAGVLVYASIGMSRGLLFPATRRQVAGHRAIKASTP